MAHRPYPNKSHDAIMRYQQDGSNVKIELKILNQFENFTD